MAGKYRGLHAKAEKGQHIHKQQHIPAAKRLFHIKRAPGLERRGPRGGKAHHKYQADEGKGRPADREIQVCPAGADSLFA